MGNVWGTANPLQAAVVFAAGSDVACPANTQTNVFGFGPLVALSPGNYFPLIFGVIAILCGATPPTACTCGFIISGGSAVDTQVLPPALLVANATIMLPLTLIGPSSSTPWLGAGASITLWLNPTAQAVTMKFAGTHIVASLFRGPDA